MQNIQFDEKAHKYLVDGCEFPSVTTILRDLGFVNVDFFTDYGRARGKLVHRIIHWHIEGTLDPSTVDPALQGYLDAWTRFESETGFVSTETEKPLGSVLHRFCGTPDYIGMLNKGESIIDCKTGSVSPWTGLQLAAYEILAGRPMKRFALALKEDGKYSLKPFTDRQDRQIFLAALSCWHWQHNNGRQ